MRGSSVRLAIVVLASVFSLSAETQPVQFAGKCGIDLQKSKETYYANPSGTGWQRYSRLQNVPELQNDSGTLARVSVSGDSRTVVRTEAPGEDFWAYHTYCFDSAGLLARFECELRTAWGWGYREERVLVPVQRATRKFFNERDGKVIATPAQAADVEEALRPEVYRKLDKVPFYGLLDFGSLKH